MTGFIDLIYAILDIITAFFEGKQRAEVMFQPEIAIAEAQRAFDDDQLDILEFSQEENVIVIRRRQYLERGVWLAINAKVDEVGGRWVSAGEDSRWEISTTA